MAFPENRVVILDVLEMSTLRINEVVDRARELSDAGVSLLTCRQARSRGYLSPESLADAEIRFMRACNEMLGVE